MITAATGLLLAGCGGGDETDTEAVRTKPLKRSELTRPAESGSLDARACDVLSTAFVARRVGAPARVIEAKPNDSLDLSICEWSGGRVRHVKLLVDSAPRAQLRYYNLLSEQHEFHNSDQARKARQIKGVGQDDAYGGAGAWWTRATRQLVAYDHDKMLKVRVNVANYRDAEARAAAVALAKRAVRRLR